MSRDFISGGNSIANNIPVVSAGTVCSLGRVTTGVHIASDSNVVTPPPNGYGSIITSPMASKIRYSVGLSGEIHWILDSNVDTE
eukprot:CAMPEP_0170058650 /NCGR_PEP_ID=MMETSP0019_2-20121128/1194_1 /TAXON_ID=98059 /ORGANISM="Dinobryon sp., Strain UTEXLB2267" /LENGTH=83 /DNA_ID=CAMNT_0010263645 /DNA_START=166 /DNA_END=417 /DNA_ORIENTATION=+